MTIDFPRETEIETKNEMDAVLQAGRVLMESGAEIYRIEDTMGHMAKSLGIRDFSTYVVNRGGHDFRTLTAQVLRSLVS